MPKGHKISQHPHLALGFLLSLFLKEACIFASGNLGRNFITPSMGPVEVSVLGKPFTIFCKVSAQGAERGASIFRHLESDEGRWER